MIIESLGERISIKRKESGLSQEKLGELFNVSRQTVYKWEADLAVPELDKLKTDLTDTIMSDPTEAAKILIS